VLQSSIGEPYLGLSPFDYGRLRREVTIIQHVAWSVNFRMRLRSFEKENIASVRNLVNLALSTSRSECPRFGFCSSVASVMMYGRDSCGTNSDGVRPAGAARTSKDKIPEVMIDDPSAASALGYSRSKWVAEHLCWRASITTPLGGRMIVFRVGQLSGDSERGIWNASEAWPMMLSAVKIIKSLPDLKNEVLDWLPVDIAARALMQGIPTSVNNDTRGMVENRQEDTTARTLLAGRGGDLTDVVHVLNDGKNPKWRQMLGWLRKRQEFETVSPKEWVAQLEKAGRGRESSHPAFKLLDHWKRAYGGEDDTAAGLEHQSHLLRFDMDNSRRRVPALRAVGELDEAYFEKIWNWIDSSM